MPSDPTSDNYAQKRLKEQESLRVMQKMAQRSSLKKLVNSLKVEAATAATAVATNDLENGTGAAAGGRTQLEFPAHSHKSVSQSYVLDLSRFSNHEVSESEDDDSDEQLSYFTSLLDDSEQEDLMSLEFRNNEDEIGNNYQKDGDDDGIGKSSELALTLNTLKVDQSKSKPSVASMPQSVEEIPTLHEFLKVHLGGYGMQLEAKKIIEMNRSAMHLIEKENPRELSHIDAWRLIDSVLRKRSEGENAGKAYNIDDCVEFLEPNMTWTLDVVSKVHELKNENGEKEFLYDVGGCRRLSAYKIRVSEEALRRIYGDRPWMWQQWALVKLEHKLRFQEGHHYHFETFDIPEYVRTLWFQWLLDPRNKDFAAHASDPRIKASQNDLFDHMMKPFYILDDIRRNDGWDFSCGFSIYSYLSIFGTGITLCLVALTMQIAIPVIIVLNTLSEVDNYKLQIEDGSLKVLEAMFCVSDDEAGCVSIQLTTYIVICIQILYISKVLPDASSTFQEVSGVGGYGPDKSYARCRSIRVRVFEHNNDKFGQLLGTILDMYMNTLFVYLVFAINLYNILNQASPTEVVLNAVALEFVFELDEVYETAVWWDNDKIWLKAGVMGIYIQSIFNFKILRSREAFCKKYHVDEKVIDDACDHDANLLFNENLAYNDCNDVVLMDDSDKFEYYALQKYAESLGDTVAHGSFTKQSTVFGLVETYFLKIYFRLTGRYYADYGLFNCLQAYRTWSRWERLLYCGTIPRADDLFELNAYEKSIVKKELGREKHSESNPFCNFSLKDSDPKSIARENRFRVLTFRSLCDSLAFSIYWGEYGRAMAWLINAALEWSTYAIQLMFPLYNLFLFVFAFYCISVPLNKLRDDEQGVNRCECRQVIPDDSCITRTILSLYTNQGEVVLNDNSDATFDCNFLNAAIKEFKFDVEYVQSQYREQIFPVLQSNQSILMEPCKAESINEVMLILQDHPVASSNSTSLL